MHGDKIEARFKVHLRETHDCGEFPNWENKQTTMKRLKKRLVSGTTPG